jgi:hypothetical protein
LKNLEKFHGRILAREVRDVLKLRGVTMNKI